MGISWEYSGDEYSLRMGEYSFYIKWEFSVAKTTSAKGFINYR